MIEPGPGILLIADPFLKDPNFLRTVVFLCEHNEDGSFGFVLNRKYENTLDELIPDLEGFKLPVFYGGPVQMDTIHFLHQCPDEIPGGEEVMKGVFWGGDFSKTVELIQNGKLDEKKNPLFYRLFWLEQGSASRGNKREIMAHCKVKPKTGLPNQTGRNLEGVAQTSWW